MNNISQALLSCTFIAIPEYIFMVIITLRLIGRKDKLDFYNLKGNTISILKIVIPPAIVINILNIIFQSPFNSLIALIILYLLLIYTLKNDSLVIYPKLFIKTFLFFILSILISISIEMVSFPIIFKLVNKTYLEIKMDFLLVILCSLSSRIIDIIILVFVLINKNNKFQINISEYIFKNKFFMRLITSLGLALILFEGYIMKLILLNNLLGIVDSIYEQLLIVIGSTFLIPSILILVVYTCTNYCVTIINSEKQSNLND